MTEEEIGDLRQCLGKFATGVAIVTCHGAKGPCGITANSFSSVSLEPPLVLWNIAKVSDSLQAYLDAGYFAINILSAGQRDLSSHFAQSDHTLFDTIEYQTNGNNVPLLPHSIACFECRTQQIHDCGDHFIIIGEIESYRSGGGEPLIFYAGQYTSLSDIAE